MKLKEFLSNLFPKKHETNNNSSKSSDEICDDLGSFKYFNDGFVLEYEDFKKEVLWESITQLNVYKKDQITIDRIEMEVVCGKKYFVVTENLPGWFQFVIKLKEVFPTIPKDWDVNIIQPPFETNFTTIYSKL
jgi:hypothetical protein